MTLLWTESNRAVPVDYRVFDKDRGRKTKNDHFSEILQAHDRGFNSESVSTIPISKPIAAVPKLTKKI